MIVGSRVRGAGLTRSEANIRAQERAATLRTARSTGLISRASEINVDQSQTSGDQLRVALERVRYYGAPRFQRQSDLYGLQRDMWTLAYIEPIVSHGISWRSMLSMGGGVTIAFADTPKGKAAAAQFKTFDDKTRYVRQRVPKLIGDTSLMGEELAVFLRQGQDGDGPAEDMRTLDPVTMNGGFAGPVLEKFDTDVPGMSGVADVESVKGYKLRGMMNDDNLIPADSATHWRWRGWGNSPHGRPLLEPCYDELWQLRDSVTNSWILINYMQRVMSFIIHVEDEDVGESIDNGTTAIGVPDFLSAYLVPYGTKMDMVKPADVMSSGDKMSRGPEYYPERRIAMTLEIPLHFVRMEFNEGNFASFLSAEAPSVAMGKKDAEWWEDLILQDFEKILPGYVAGEDYVITVQPLIMRDRHKDREQLLAAHAQRILSRQTVQERFEVDPIVEETRLEEERDQRLALIPQGLNPNGGLDGGQQTQTTDDDTSGEDDRAQEAQKSSRTSSWLAYRPHMPLTRVVGGGNGASHVT